VRCFQTNGLWGNNDNFSRNLSLARAFRVYTVRGAREIARLWIIHGDPSEHYNNNNNVIKNHFIACEHWKPRVVFTCDGPAQHPALLALWAVYYCLYNVTRTYSNFPCVYLRFCSQFNVPIRSFIRHRTCRNNTLVYSRKKILLNVNRYK